MKKTKAAFPRTVLVAALQPGQPAANALYHETATPILAKGQKLTEEHIRALNSVNIAELYECQTEDDVLVLAAATAKQPLSLADLNVGVPVPHNIYSDKHTFLLRKGGVLTAAQRQRMHEAGVQQVFVDIQVNRQALNRYYVELTKLRAAQMEQKFGKEESLQVTGGLSLLPQLFAKSPRSMRPKEQLAKCEKNHTQNILQAADLLYSLQQAQDIDGQQVARVSHSLFNQLLADVNLTLNLAHAKDPAARQLDAHSTSVAALAIGVGLALGYVERDLRELGQAALLHEVGMLALSPQLINKREPLDSTELEEMQRHPIHALDYLRRARGLSDRVAIAVYQEHEMPNRGGYPNQRPGYLLHDFGKIIHICDAYDAMTSPRAFRDALLPYRVMEHLVKAATQQQFDAKVLNALLQVVGLFPVGSWVKLSTRKYAKVTGNNPNRYDRPVVNMLFDSNLQPLAVPEIVNLTERLDIQIEDVADGRCFPGASTMGF